MPGLDLITIFVNRLNKVKVRYMATGSVACTIYGEPRLTHDIDLVVELNPQDISGILRLSSDLLNLDFIQKGTRDYRLTEEWQRAVEMART
jgi:hypothetical protein